MPSPPFMPSAAKRGRGPMQRQLSLQGSATPMAAPADRRGGLRRQSSEDLGLRIGCGQQDRGVEKVRAAAANRPKPVRMAWGERKTGDVNGETVEAVEVIARRCAGLPRPPSRTRLPPSLSLLDHQPSALTRQQLADRLRRAWKDRDRKPNLDIVLAHSRPESSISARTEDSLHTTRTPVKGIHCGESIGRVDTADEFCIHETYEKAENLEIDLVNLGNKPPEVNLISPIDTYCKPRMFLRATSFSSQFSSDKENIDTKDENCDVSRPSSVITASERRASFKSSQLLNRTINGSFSDDLIADDGGNFKVFLTKTSSRPPLQRTSSAPTERSKPRSPSPAAAKPVKTPKPVEKKSALLFREPCGADESDNSNQKSTTRKKFKNLPPRRKVRDDSSDDEELAKTEIEKKKAPPRRRPMPKEGFGGEIITMVSLVSPAESDVEEPIMTLPLTVSDDEKEEEPKTQEQAKDFDANILLQKCIALRKPIKTVSFQAHPPVSRSCSASFPLRRVPPGAPIITPTPITTPSVSALERQLDRGVKRRMVRSRTVPVKDDDENGSSDERTDTSTEPVSGSTRSTPSCMKDGGTEEVGYEEQEIKSPKEKECWALYKKMLDKGVAVSYDTVLRGMLTPTEYRLRTNRLARC